MSLHQASFKVKHECPYRTLSAEQPDLTIREWFMNEYQILEVSTQEAPSEELSRDIEELGSVLYRASDTGSLYLVIQSSLCSLDDSLITRFETHNCLYMPPTVYQGGWEHYTVTAFDDRDVRQLLSDLDRDRDIEVLSTTATETRRVPHTLFTSMDSLFAGLTDRQLEALRIAVDNGYFEQPRQVSIEELASRTSVARSTYEEHLRKAQNKLIANTEPFVRLLSEREGCTRLRDRSRTPASP
jgi:predicted DNA binding protein